ncbi:MAG: hypothetical protein H0U87_04760 [Acidobacteria bacterium]|jgi:hypothetical protein|nr:hypothetical protein [Acidobacteriota bacterium]
MNGLERSYTVTRKDLAKGKALALGAWASPFFFAFIPSIVFFILYLLFGSTPPVAATYFFLSLISLFAGGFLGLMISGGLLYHRSRWSAQLRERIAADGIKAQEVDWFKKELSTAEKHLLKEIEAKNQPLLTDAVRDTLAVRLTATRILKSTKQELLLVERRQNKLKYLKSENSNNLQNDLKIDFEKLEIIKSEAEQMRVEAETRLQMLDAAARRGTTFNDSELTLKKLAARTAELPLALESAKMEQEIRRELEKELESDK